MAPLILKKEYVDKIKTDPILYGRVAGALQLSPTSLLRLLYANDTRLTQASVMQVLREHLKKQDKELLTSMVAA